MERIEVGIKLREARKQKGLTQQMLAEAVDISEMYISQIERGLKMPSLNIFIKIITVLDISSDYVGDMDDIKSRTEFVFTLYRGPTVALSTTET